MKMAGPMQPGQPLFTIEQIELIRRLRNSGITKDQLTNAFETLERIDRELGPIYTIPVSLAAHPFISLHQMGPAMMQQVAVAASLQRQLSQATLLQQQQQQQQQQQVAMQAQKRPLDETGETEMTNGINSRSLMTTPLSQDEADEIEDTEEFKEFAGRGDAVCCEEIRQFVAQYNIKQQQVATLSGISQSYVSRYLKGDFHDMSERSRKAIQRWYITFRKNPAAIGPAANATLLNSPSPVKKFISMDPNSSEFVNYPRRERFVFRPSHLEVLERHFLEDSYPSQEKREEIARICNAAVEIPAGRVLGDRERVSAQIVSNWFANKRKEVKKIAREEGIPPSQVPLRGRGRPSRFNMYDLSDAVTNGNGMANGLNGSQAHHQHQTQLDMEMSMELKMSPTALGVQGSPPSLHHPMSPPANMAPPTTMAPPSNMPPPASAPPYSSVSTSNEQQEHQQSSHQQEHENSEKTAGMHPQMAASNGNIAGLEMAEADDQSLSLAVEMAAVNQAIIALSGQTPVPPIHVKPEKE